MSLAAAAGGVNRSIQALLMRRKLEELQQQQSARADQSANREDRRLDMQGEAQRALAAERVDDQAYRSRQEAMQNAGIRIGSMTPNQDVSPADAAAIQGTPYEGRLRTQQTLATNPIGMWSGTPSESSTTLRPDAQQQAQINATAEERKALAQLPAHLVPLVNAGKAGLNNINLSNLRSPSEAAEAAEAAAVSDDKRRRDYYAFQKRTDASYDKPDDEEKGGKSEYALERIGRMQDSVRELLPMVSNWTVGFGSLLGAVPESQAVAFASKLETLKASIAFAELTEMREASKTGGALGQVSERELSLLTNARAALNTKMSPEDFRAELQKIEASLARWDAAVEASRRGEEPDTKFYKGESESLPKARTPDDVWKMYGGGQ